MKIGIFVQTLLVTLAVTSAANSAQITNTLDGVSQQLQCNETWTDQNIVLRFTQTIASEDGTGGYCSFGIEPASVWLYPSRLELDFTPLKHLVTRIEADIDDYCGAGCTRLFAYNGASQIATVANATVHQQTLVLNFDTSHPDRCAIRSFEARVDEIRISTSTPPRLDIETTGASVAVSWPTNVTGYRLEKTDSLTGLTGWTSQTNNVQLEGSNFVCRIAAPAAAQFFRLRGN
jgi:hypothetical protein